MPADENATRLLNLEAHVEVGAVLKLKCGLKVGFLAGNWEDAVANNTAAVLGPFMRPCRVVDAHYLITLRISLTSFHLLCLKWNGEPAEEIMHRVL